MKSTGKPLLLRALNRLFRLRHLVFKKSALLSSDGILRASKKKAPGSSIHGAFEFKDSLAKLVNEINNSGSNSAIGVELIKRSLVDAIVYYNRVKEYHSQYKEIGSVRIEKPLFIMALPRTGTTLFQRLLAEDHANRWIRYWEVSYPHPADPKFLQDRRYLTDDRRVGYSKSVFRILNIIAPSFRSIHYSDGIAPDECYPLLEKTMTSYSFMLMGPFKGYLDWLDSLDMDSWRKAYEFYRDSLLLLQWWYWKAERWVLKSPFHAWNPEALLNVFPDARIVCIHRDPLEVVPSSCSFVATLQSIYANQVDRKKLGAFVSDSLMKASRRLAAVMDSESGKNFYHINYRDLTRDPLNSVKGMYAHFGIHLDEAASVNFKKYIEQNPASLHGEHKYALEDYGLSKNMILNDFSDYYGCCSKRFAF